MCAECEDEGTRGASEPIRCQGCEAAGNARYFSLQTMGFNVLGKRCALKYFLKMLNENKKRKEKKNILVSVFIVLIA